MAYVYYNPNPSNKRQSIGDCVIRAISKIFNYTWDRTYAELCVEGFQLKDWGNSNEVWDSYLRKHGFKRNVIPNTCPMCYTVSDFCHDNPSGVFLLATGSHVIAVVNGNYYDSWDSGQEVPIYYYK